jgi:hypothetical protein
MSNIQQFKDKLREFNKNAGVPHIHEVAKSYFPDCETMQMGYHGGYSWVMKGNLLTDHIGKPIPTDIKMTNLDIYFDGSGDFAFGTIVIDHNGKTHQIYTIDGRMWLDDVFEIATTFHNEAIMVGSVGSVEKYILALKENKKMGSKTWSKDY